MRLSSHCFPSISVVHRLMSLSSDRSSDTLGFPFCCTCQSKRSMVLLSSICSISGALFQGLVTTQRFHRNQVGGGFFAESCDTWIRSSKTWTSHARARARPHVVTGRRTGNVICCRAGQHSFSTVSCLLVRACTYIHMARSLFDVTWISLPTIELHDD